MFYVADFETSVNTEKSKTWVYLWGLMFEDGWRYGTNIHSFFDVLTKLENNSKLFFHNIKFDGSLILNHLLQDEKTYLLIDEKETGNLITHSRIRYKNKGFKKELRKEGDKNYVEVFINQMNVWYTIDFYCVRNKVLKHIKIIDSLKLLNTSIDNMATEFLGWLDKRKLTIDYSEIIEEDSIPSEKQLNYLKRDCEILYSSIKKLVVDYKFEKNTVSGNSLWEYKKLISKKEKSKEINDFFEKYFPTLDINDYKFMRCSYKGGVSYVNPVFQNQLIGTGEKNIGFSIDANSMYSSQMSKKGNLFPYGKPIFYDGFYKKDERYPVFIQRFKCSFELKKGKLPFISFKPTEIKENPFINLPFNEIISSSAGQIVTMTLSSVDLEQFSDNYTISNFEPLFGFKFKGSDKLFKKYVDKYGDMKITAVEEENKSSLWIAKTFLNGLYGKFGMKAVDVYNKRPFVEKGVLKFENTVTEDVDGIYIPVAIFTTSYARKDLIEKYNAITSLGLKFLYCDTDSLHFLGNWEKVKQLDFLDDGKKFGCWKRENFIKKCKFIRPKTYMLETEKNLKIKVAGLPKKSQNLINFENFNIGLELENAKTFLKQVEGGAIIVSTDFNIKVKEVNNIDI